MSVVIGDIHGCVEKVQAFLAYKPEEEHIALGDIVDSPFEPPSRQMECLNLLFDAGTVLLWGNHDIQYANLLAYPCSRNIQNSPVAQVVLENQHRFMAAYSADGYILTHAGVCTQISNGCSDPVVLAGLLNNRLAAHRALINSARDAGEISVDSRDPIFNVSRHRGGWDEYSGIFWFDPFCEDTLDRGLRQIYGHCEINKKPGLDEFGHINLNYNGRDTCYLFDTKMDDVVKINFCPMDKDELEDLYFCQVTRRLRGDYYNTFWLEEWNSRGDSSADRD